MALTYDQNLIRSHLNESLTSSLSVTVYLLV